MYSGTPVLSRSRWVIWATLFLATLNFVRFYVTSLTSYVSLPQYGAGIERMPFQGRMLLMLPMRWASQSPALQHWASGRPGALGHPQLAVVYVIGLASVLLTGILVTVLYSRVASTGGLPYLPWALMLLVCGFNYTAHIEQSLLFVYDLPSLLFFTVGIWLVYERMFWPLLVLFPFATLNRETTLFLIILMALDAMATEKGLEWRRLLQGRLVLQLGVLSAVWIAVQMYVRHRFRDNPTEMFPRLLWNLRWLAHPNVWPEILSACAFLLPFLLLWRGRIRDYRIRAYVLIIWPWLLFVLVWGLVIEQRVYGELSALVGLAATLTLEGSLRARAPQRVPARSEGPLGS